MLGSISHSCYSSTDHVLSLPELQGQPGTVSNPSIQEYSSVFIKVLFTAILGILTAQEEMVLPRALALQGPGEVVFLVPTCPVSLRAVTLLLAAPRL